MEIGNKLPQIDLDRLNRIKYYRGSVNDIHQYVDLNDANGKPVIVRQLCESLDEYETRKRITNPRNHIAPIVNKYYSSVFRQDPEVEPRLQDFYKQFSPTIRDGLYESEIIGRSFLLLENNLDGSELSVAQAFNSGVQESIVFLPEESVRSVEIVDGRVISALVTFQDPDGVLFARNYLADGTAQEIIVNDKEVIQSVSEPYMTGYTECPIVAILPKTRLVPILADSQKAIANYISLLANELYNHTFSQTLLSGLDMSNKSVEEIAQMKLEMAKNRFICTGESVTPSTLGSDVQQSESIRKSIQDEEDNLFNLAGLREPSSVAGESGAAKLIEADSFYIIVTGFVDALETAINSIIRMMGDRIGTVYDPIYFSRSFVTPDYSSMILELRDILSLNIPQELKDQAIENFRLQYFGE